jgi:DNA primase large subunit
MYRMPYSFNEKSGLVSIPLNPKKIPDFDKSMAVAEKIAVEHAFLPRKNIISGEASKLLVQAFDYHPPENSIITAPKSLKQKEDFSVPLQAVPEQYFPPCIQNIAKGLHDGKKRAAFLLINFLTSLGWNYEQIEEYLKNWNAKNPEPLRDQYYLGQLRYHQQQKKQALPPNCSNKAYLVGMGVCTPDSFCGANSAPGSENFSPRIKNPVNYALKKQRLANLTKKPEKKTNVK